MVKNYMAAMKLFHNIYYTLMMHKLENDEKYK